MLGSNIDQLPFTLTIPQVAELLGVNRNSAYELAHRHDFPSIQIGKRLLVPTKEFLKWLELEAQKVS